MDAFVNFYFHWLRIFGGWVIILILAVLPAVWLLNDSEARMLPARWWRLGILLSFLLLLPTLILGGNAALNPAVVINPHRPEAQFAAAMGLVMLVLIWVVVVGYIISYWGMIGSETGQGLYRWGTADHFLMNAQISALGGAPLNVETLFPAREYANAVLIASATQMRYPLLKGLTRLGRSRQNDVVLDQDRSVSRRHGMIWETQESYVLHNFSGNNPIYYNGQPMTQGQTYILRHGDTLRLGRTQLMFSIGA